MRRTIERRPRRVQRTSLITRARVCFLVRRIMLGDFQWSRGHVGSQRTPVRTDREYACRAVANQRATFP